jgi:peptidoglycan/LPS O-acetylase OafA/YrhL
VFFVLSGFLITSIVLHDILEGSFALAEFYTRRIQRLVPNAVATVLAVLVLSSLILMPSSLKQVASHSIWTLFNFSNFYIWQHFGGYWGDTAGAAPLLHTWSLAVEEQFYMLFPAAMMLLARFQRKHITHWLIAATVLSLALCIYATPRHAAVSFYMLPTRVWELLFGAVLASYRASRCQEKRSSPLIQELTGWVGLALILSGFIWIDETDGFPGVWALLPTVGTLLVLISVTQDTRVARFLAAPIMVSIGKLSYSLYLWHWPMITLGKALATRYEVPSITGAVLGLVASIGLAVAAYLLVEQPLRKRGPGKALHLAIIGSGFLVAVLASVAIANGPKLDTTRFFDPPEFHGLLYSVGKPDFARGNAIRYQDVRFPVLDGKNNASWRSGGIIHHFGDGPPKVVVLGSSHALMYSALIDSICKTMGVPVAFFGMDGVPVFFNSKVDPALLSGKEATEFDEARRHWLRIWRPQAVFVIDRWDLRDTNSKDFNEDLRSFLREVSPLTKEVLFVAQIPVTDIGGESVNIRELVSWRKGHGDSAPRFLPDRNEKKRQLATGLAMAEMSEFPNLRVLRPDLAFYREDGSVRWASGRTVYYTDDNHVADAGAELVRGIFQNAIAEATHPE